MLELVSLKLESILGTSEHQAQKFNGTVESVMAY
jgi:hypothetical protein